MAKKSKEFEYEYDPVKEVQDEKSAAVIWTTKSLNRALDGIQKGLPLKVNPFVGKNTKLLKPDLVYKRTAEEIEDYIRCKNDPLYFATKCFLMTPEGLQPVKLRDYQEDYIEHLKNNRFSIFLSCRQSGKCFGFDTKLNILINGKETILPYFEIHNMYCNRTFIWKLKYCIYKMIYNIKKNV